MNLKIPAHIPIYAPGEKDSVATFFKSYFHYGNSRYEYANIKNERNEIGVRLNHASQPFWLIALKIITIVTVIFPIIALLYLDDANIERMVLRYYEAAEIPLNLPPKPLPLPFPAPPKPLDLPPVPLTPKPFLEPLPPPLEQPAPAPLKVTKEELIKWQKEKKNLIFKHTNSFSPKFDYYCDADLAILEGGTPVQIVRRMKQSTIHWIFPMGIPEDLGPNEIGSIREAIANIHQMLDTFTIPELKDTLDHIHFGCYKGTSGALANAVARKTLEDYDLIPDPVLGETVDQRIGGLIDIYLKIKAKEELSKKGRPFTQEERNRRIRDREFKDTHYQIEPMLDWMRSNDYLGDKAPKVSQINPRTYKRGLFPFTEQLARDTLDNKRYYYVEYGY